MIESTFTLQYGGQRPTWKLTLTLDPVILFIYLFIFETEGQNSQRQLHKTKTP